MDYTLELTEQDIKTIAFISGCYEWSNELQGYEHGQNTLSEAEAWELKEAIELDMEGGHDAFPMLDPNSDLCAKLAKLYLSII